MGASHDHAQHSHTSNRRRLALAFGITALVFVSQLVGSILTGSLALLVDTAHMLTDVIALLMALTAASLMLRPPSDTHTWGFRRAEVISASIQAIILFSVGVYALIEAIRRFFEPTEIPGKMLLIFASIGLLANIVAMFVLMGGKDSNLNMKAAFLEVTTDALGSVAVIIGALAMILFDFGQADVIAAIFIAILILPRALHLARQALDVLLEKTPREIDLATLREHIRSQEHVIDVYDLHVSRISSDYPVLTAHVTVEDHCFNDGHVPEILESLHECVREHFPIRIDHATFQIEPARLRHDAC